MPFEASGPTEVRRITAPDPPPNVVETEHAGRFEFVVGVPTDETIAKVWDHLDFQRACQVFLRHMMAAAVWGFHQGMTRDLGLGANEVAVLRLNASGLVLTGNSETVYGFAILDTKPGPLVVDVPPGVLGFLNDQWMRPMVDMGIAGPDAGKGGPYLLVPPGYEGELPSTGFVQTVRLRTYRQWLVLRGFLGPDGDAQPAIDTISALKVYPLAAADAPPPTRAENVTGKPFDTIHPMDARYFEDLAEIVEYEPYDAIDPEVSAQLAQIGIEKGAPFAPDERMRTIFDEAAQVAGFMAFAEADTPREPFQRRADRQYHDTVPNYPTFRDEHDRPMVDHMVRMAWFGTGRALAMGSEKPGVGSAYTWAYKTADGSWIDPHRAYRMRLPGPIPAKNYWSVVVYDLWTRSLLANGQEFPSLNTYSPDIELNDDDGVDVYFGPEPPAGKDGNWIRTLPDVPWFPMLRLYGPLEPWIDRSWMPDDLVAID